MAFLNQWYDEDNNTLYDLEDTTNRKNIAPIFDSNTNYTKGDIVLYETDGKLYEFTTTHSAGAWNSAHVTQININDRVTEAKILIVEFSSLTATSGTLITISNTKIKSYTSPLPFIFLSNPAYQLDDWTITIPDNGGQVSITGTAQGTGVSGKIYLINPQ